MAENSSRPLAPVPPDAMELIVFYKCPRCGRHIGLPAPTEPRLIPCDACQQSFPVIPVDEYSLHYLQILTAGGKALADPDFI